MLKTYRVHLKNNFKIIIVLKSGGMLIPPFLLQQKFCTGSSLGQKKIFTGFVTVTERFIMNNTISSNINFNGAFKIDFNKTLTGTRKYLEKSISGTKGVTVYDDFGSPNNTLYILRNSKDYDFAQFIKKNELKFEYIPEIDTTTKQSKKELLSAIEEKKVTIIDKISTMIDFVTNNRIGIQAKKPTVKTHEKLLKNIFHNLKDKKAKNSQGIVTLEDKTTGEMMKISPKSKFGITYIYHKPALKNEAIERFAVDDEGNILASFNSPSSIIKFGENFNNAVKHHLHKD